MLYSFTSKAKYDKRHANNIIQIVLPTQIVGALLLIRQMKVAKVNLPEQGVQLLLVAPAAVERQRCQCQEHQRSARRAEGPRTDVTWADTFNR